MDKPDSVPPVPERSPLTDVTAPRPVFSYQAPAKKRRWRFKFTRKKVLIGGGITLAAIGVGVGIFLFVTARRVITSNRGTAAPALDGKIDPSKLRGEGDGRINILLLGIGGSGHAGADLSDTVMVVSIDPRTHDTAMLSIPRDLYVPIPGYGSSRINEANSDGESGRYPGGGPALAKAVVEKVLDIPIHYYIKVDFAGFRQAIDAVGGVDINVEQALYDPEYPCDKDERLACGFSLSAGQHHMDGTLALKYSRCRKGTCGNDFGRADRQQRVLVALRQKALQLQTLANPAKVLSLVSAVGSHLRTDLQPDEIKKLVGIAKDLDASKIVQKVLDTTAEGLLTDANIGGAYVEIPRAGAGNFSEIRDLVHTLFADSYIKEENAAIAVQNGTTKSGLATTVGKLLKTYNYNVVRTETADQQNYATTVIYDYSGGKKPYTVAYLEKRFGVKAKSVSLPAGETADIKLIVGADYRPPAN